jgi:hypothetical protein
MQLSDPSNPHDQPGKPKAVPSPFRRTLNTALVVLAAQIAFVGWLFGDRVDYAYVAGRFTANMFFTFLIIWFFSRKKAWSYVSTAISVFLLSTILHFTMNSREHQEAKNQNEAALLSILELIKGQTEVLESIKDERSAREAMPRVDSHLERMKTLKAQAAQLPKLLQRDADELRRRYDQPMTQAGERLAHAMKQAQERSGGVDVASKMKMFIDTLTSFAQK